MRDRSAPASPRRRTIFVHGSLLRGESNHAEVAGARFLGEARTEPVFELVDLGEYPAIVRGGATAVHGELCAVPPALLAALDVFEGHPGFYRRGRLRLEGGRRVEAYVLPPHLAEGKPRIAGGIGSTPK